MIWIVALFTVVLGAPKDCSSAVSDSDLDSSPDSYFYERLSCSGKGPNDLGKYEACLRIPNSVYYLLEQKIYGNELIIGVCVDSACTPEDIESAMIQTLATVVPESNLEVTAVVPKELHLGLGGIIMVMLVTLLISLGVLGSWIDSQSKSSQLPSINTKRTELQGTSIQYEPIIRSPPPFYYRVIQCFSLSKNFTTLITSRPKQSGDARSTLDCLNSVRALSIVWIISAHCFAYRMGFGVKNLENIGNIAGRNWVALSGYGAFYAVDSFFWLGGFLFAFFNLGTVYSKNGNLSLGDWISIYVHRLCRILPVYMFCMLFYMYVVDSLGSGPIWHKATLPVQECFDYWWTNLLFINNFVPNGVGNTCFGTGWYLACDMQFFLFAPVLVYMYYKYSGKINWLLHTVLILLCILISFIIVQDHNLKVVVSAPENTQGDLFHNYYFKPYTRYAPYLLGLLTGCIFYNYVKKSQDPSFNSEDIISDKILYYLKDTKYGAHISFTVGLSIVLYDILIQKNVYKDFPFAGEWSETENALFMSSSKTVFVIGLIMMILPVLVGKLSLVYTVMAWGGWDPFAKMAYSAFNVHFAVLFWILASTESGVIYNGYQVFKDSIETLALTWVISLAVYLLVESPFINLEQFIFIKKSEKKDLLI